jgi:hypothetical protein
MKIAKVSPVTARLNVRDINVTSEQMSQWRNGALIQEAMPHVSIEDREFLITGATPEDWNAMSLEEEEE